MSIRRIFNKGYALLRRAKIGRQNFERGVSLDVDFDHVGRRQLLIIQPDAIHRSGSVFTNSRTTAVLAKSLPRFGIRNGGGDYVDIILNRDIFAEKGSPISSICCFSFAHLLAQENVPECVPDYEKKQQAKNDSDEVDRIG